MNDLVSIHYNLRLRNRVTNKRKNFDPIDYESIDQFDYWITEEDNFPLLDYDELQNMLYNQDAIPRITVEEG
ncbi:hypothetical protein G2W53_007900 [Senna tora]|uniref:Uncharacterized protein n=1 Tax=Senna tora TaxID=362788 RepID=A0A834X7I8_9FABA|nr:hypothetical protein G2W53_007900 [Senna tora]